MTDPLQEIFGIAAPELFGSTELVIEHGPLARFPDFMWSGAMESVESLSRSYSGALEVAKGSVTDGLQTGVSGVHPVALLKLGLTVFFPDLRRCLPRSSAWLKSLEDSLGLPECASLMAFANAAGSGLSLHHDRYDQLFFQICGQKQFRYAPSGYVVNPDVQFSPYAAAHIDFGPSYRHGFPLTSEEVLARPFQTVELNPGSAFFMPAGTWHTTAEQASDSLSLVVAVRAPSNADLLLNVLRHYLNQSPDWRARGYGGWAQDRERAEPARDRLAGLVTGLGERLDRLSAADMFQAWSAHGYAVGIQAEYPKRARFERFIRLPSSSLRFEDDTTADKWRCIVLAGPTNRPRARTVLAINREARPLVEWMLASQAAFTVTALVATFPDFAQPDVEDLLAWLAHAGLIRPLLAPEWDDD